MSQSKTHYYPDGDVILEAENTLFKVHGLILKMVSPYFEARLSDRWTEAVTSDFPGGNAPETQLALPRLKLTDKKADTLNLLLTAIYPHTVPEVTMENMRGLVDLADEYLCMDTVRTYIHVLLLRKYQESPLESLLMAEKTECKDVLEKCMKLVTDQFPRYFQNPDFELLSGSTRNATALRWNDYVIWMLGFPDRIDWRHENVLVVRANRLMVVVHENCKSNLKLFIYDSLNTGSIKQTFEKLLHTPSVNVEVLKNCSTEVCAKRITDLLAESFPREKFI